MHEKTNFGALLKSMNLSNKALSDMLSVHYSLVSKWVTGQRTLRSDSEQLRRIVEALLNFERPKKFENIRRILQDYYPTVNLYGEVNIRTCLTSFLSVDLCSSETTDWDKVDYDVIDSSVRMDTYFDNEGRRNAFIRLLDSALSLPKGQEILAFGRDSLDWESSSPVFENLWTEKYMDFLRHGGKITIIHSLDRPLKEIIYSLTRWFPLHLTRKTEARYLMEYVDTPVTQFMTTLRGRATIFGLSVDGAPSKLTTFYSKNYETVNMTSEYFDGVMQRTQPLFVSYENEQISKAALDLSGAPGHSYRYASLPLQYGISEVVFSKILTENKITGEAYKRCMDFYEKDRNILKNTLSKYKTRLLLTADFLSAGLNDGLVISIYNWLMDGERLYISPEHVRQTLNGYIEYLTKYDNFEIALQNTSVMTQMPKVSLSVKENASVFTNSTWPDVQSPLFIYEQTTVTAFYKYMDSIWNSSSQIARMKSHVIPRLREMAETE